MSVFSGNTQAFSDGNQLIIHQLIIHTDNQLITHEELDLDKLLDDVGKGDEDHEDDDEGVHGEGGEDEGAPRNGVLCASDLEANVSYVIVDYEGSFFPGMVTEIKDANVKVSCMVPAPSKMRKTFWKWPEIEDTCWYTIDKVIEKIQTPVLVGNRGKYQVDEAEKFVIFF